MTEMIDGVAEAICRDLGGQWQASKDWPAGKLYRHLARAAIRAMRNPTAAMVQRVRADKPHDQDAEIVWFLMADAALGEKA